MSDSTLTARAEADLLDIAVSGYRQFGILYAPGEGGILILAIIHGRSVRGLDL